MSSLFHFTGVLSSTKVHQFPLSLFRSPTDSFNLSCNHSISSYNTILWYKQSEGRTVLKLIGYVYYKKSTVEKEFEDFFDIHGNGEEDAVLSFQDLRRPEDDAVYFCAASKHSASETLSPLTKTSASLFLYQYLPCTMLHASASTTITALY